MEFVPSCRPDCLLAQSSDDRAILPKNASYPIPINVSRPSHSESNHYPQAPAELEVQRILDT